MTSDATKPVHIVVMGVAGSGKSTLGLQLAQAMDLQYIEGDDYHLASSVKKMAAGEPLLDSDRLPWLRELNRLMREASGSLVISCSSLKAQYRRELADRVDLKFVYLDISPELALARVSSREHFFPTSLVQDQFKTLEVPEKNSRVLWCDASKPIDELVGLVCRRLSNSVTTARQQSGA